MDELDHVPCVEEGLDLLLNLCLDVLLMQSGMGVAHMKVQVQALEFVCTDTTVSVRVDGFGSRIYLDKVPGSYGFDCICLLQELADAIVCHVFSSLVFVRELYTSSLF